MIQLEQASKQTNKQVDKKRKKAGFFGELSGTTKREKN